MEHRWSARKPHQCHVVVDCPRLGPAVARVRNIGIGGMFVETENTNLPLNAAVSVAFTLHREGYREDFRLPAMVIHRRSDGAGIMFLDSRAETLRTLRRALYDAPSQKSPGAIRQPATRFDVRVAPTALQRPAYKANLP